MPFIYRVTLIEYGFVVIEIIIWIQITIILLP